MRLGTWRMRRGSWAARAAVMLQSNSKEVALVVALLAAALVLAV